MNPKSLFEENLKSIKRIATSIARRKHLNADDCDEFVQVVCVRLIENDYAILRKFEGRSSMSTYLITVIGRLYNEWRDRQWGKWRPSAEARRLGDLAITLERMLTRDGMSFSEAVNTLTIRSGALVSIAELEAIYLRLPPRNPRPMEVSGEVSPDAASVAPDAEDRVAAEERERTARRVEETIDSVLGTFGPEDRLILELRFWNSRKVREIAEVVNIDAKKLFKRLEKLFTPLRRALETAGISAADIALLESGDHDIHLNLRGPRGNDPLGPSNDKGRGSQRRRGRL